MAGAVRLDRLVPRRPGPSVSSSSAAKASVRSSRFRRRYGERVSFMVEDDHRGTGGMRALGDVGVRARVTTSSTSTSTRSSAPTTTAMPDATPTGSTSTRSSPHSCSTNSSTTCSPSPQTDDLNSPGPAEHRGSVGQLAFGRTEARESPHRPGSAGWPPRWQYRTRDPGGISPERIIPIMPASDFPS